MKRPGLHHSDRGQRRRFLLQIVAALVPLAASGHHQLSKDECKRITQQMKSLQSRLRQAHSASQGRRYREKMRALQLQRFRKC